MRTSSKLVVSVALSAGLVGGMIAAGPASAAGNKEKFCEKAGELGVNLQEGGGSATTEDAAADLEKAFKKLAKPAPTKKLKKAVKVIAQYYGEIADGNTEQIGEELSEKYGTAIADFGTYVATDCLTEAIPDITLPGGGEIEIPGLPGS